ncbi:MAG TPA: hypothetical protein VFD58_22465 [Blastocatellia bacterium]|nr:hypothetical protein [Blastocatellia bacterium]
MKKRTAVSAFLSALFFCHALAQQGELFTPRPGESSGDFAARVIPPGTKLAHPVVQGSFGPSAKSLVVLFGKEEDRPYTGWILIPQGEGYRKVELPRIELMWSHTEVKAVFFANADRDADNELLVLCDHYTGIGPTGARPFYYTWVYDWNGREVVWLEKISEKIGTLATAGKVRRRLRALGYRPARSAKTGTT